MENNNWIPVSSGIFPDDMEDVQVLKATFMSCHLWKVKCLSYLPI